MSARSAVLGPRAFPRRAVARVLRAAATRAPSPHLQRRLLILAAACSLLSAAYLFWFRDSSLVQVERVSVTGLSTRDAPRLRAALASTARSMTTLHVDHDRLMRAVAGFPVVRELEVSSDFPHTLRIEVIQHAPAAIAISHGLRIPVAGDGTLLRGVPVEGRLPELRVSGALPPERLRDPRALRLARVAGGAPAALAGRLEEVRENGDRGITVEVREGPTLIFGDASRVRAKWAAAARVLADPSASGASYVDLRLPDRPAAGGVAAETVTPVAPASGLPAPTPEAATTDPAPQTPEPTSTAPAGEQAPPAPQAPAGTTPQTPPQPQQGPTQPQQAPPAQSPPPQAGPGGGATANPQP